MDPDSQPLDVLVRERDRLVGLIEQEREQVEALEQIVGGLKSQCERHEFHLRQIDSVLGRSPQIQLEDSNLLLRGQRIGKVAVEILTRERGEHAEVHYTEWFELLKIHGHLVAGKDPVNNFLTEINRSPQVRKVGKRTGRYRLFSDAA